MGEGSAPLRLRRFNWLAYLLPGPWILFFAPARMWAPYLVLFLLSAAVRAGAVSVDSFSGGVWVLIWVAELAIAYVLPVVLGIYAYRLTWFREGQRWQKTDVSHRPVMLEKHFKLQKDLAAWGWLVFALDLFLMGLLPSWAHLLKGASLAAAVVASRVMRARTSHVVASALPAEPAPQPDSTPEALDSAGK